jgi:hypothetical protein
MVDDLIGDGDGATGRGVVGGGDERKLGFRVLEVLGFRVHSSPELGEV